MTKIQRVVETPHRIVGNSPKFQACNTEVTRYSRAVVTSLVEFFGPQSPLTKLLPGYQPREGQAWMAEAVEEAIATRSQLVVEAGTGTGKTFAYLLPALESGCKTIISTGTKALQDQLFHRDLPLISQAVGRPASTALLERDVPTIFACTGLRTWLTISLLTALPMI